MARRIVRLALLALAACGPNLGEPGAWTPIGEIVGALAPETAAPPVASTPGESLRVVTFNVEFGDDLTTAMHDLVTRGFADADVIFAQEIESHPEDGASQTAQLAAALGMGYVYSPSYTKGTGTHGVAILSRHALRDARVRRLAAPKDYPRDLPRQVLEATLDTPSGPVTLRCMHLDTRLSAAERALQMRPAVESPGGRMIVGGDLNTNPYVWGLGFIPDMPAGAVADTDQAPIIDDYVRALGYTTPTADAGATCRLGPVHVRVDSLFTFGVTPVTSWVDRAVNGSDHWPLSLEVQLTSP